MINTDKEIKQIKKETFISIVDCIYFKHYKRWYDKFFNEKEKIEYNKSLHFLSEKISKDIEKKDHIEMNGHYNVLPIDTTNNSGFKIRKSIKLLSFILLFIISLFIVGLIEIFIQKRLGLDTSSQTLIFTISSILVLFFSSILFENKSNFFSSILEKIIDKI